MKYKSVRSFARAHVRKQAWCLPIAFLFFVFISVADGLFTAATSSAMGEWDPWLGFWQITMLATLGFFSVLLAAVAFANSAKLACVVAILVQPWLLVWGGVLDVISLTCQDLVWRIPFQWLNMGFEWVWLDPSGYTMHGVTVLPYIYSRMLGHVHVVSLGMALGAITVLAVMFTMWMLCWAQ